MATTPVYLLKILENPAIEISRDELRSLLSEIETELHRSKVYRRALVVLQKLLGSSSEQAHALFKAVGREAIGLAFQQFMQHYQKVEENNHHVDNKDNKDNNDSKDKHDETPVVVEEPDSSDLSQCLTNVKVHQPFTHQTPSKVDLPSKSQVVKATEDTSTKTKPTRWFKSNRKPNKAEMKEMAAQQRVESLRQIGQQLRQIRESQGLSLSQLNVYTHVPIHQMEAIENGNWALLPEDVYVRGFIRVMGNALGLNGTHLAASLPAPEPTKLVLPSYYQPKQTVGLGLGLRPVHLYVGYTALVAGSVGGLSIMSQQASANKLINTSELTPSSSLNQSLQAEKPTTKPGLQSSGGNVTVGSDISPPEAL